MSTRCPICRVELVAARFEAFHMAAAHSADAKRITVIAAELQLPVVECDIDSIHTSPIVAAKKSKAAA